LRGVVRFETFKLAYLHQHALGSVRAPREVVAFLKVVAALGGFGRREVAGLDGVRGFGRQGGRRGHDSREREDERDDGELGECQVDGEESLPS
jgi:hypothetical protein